MIALRGLYALSAFILFFLAIEVITSCLLTALDARLAQWRGDGFNAIRADWLARAAGLGDAITVRLPDAELNGKFLGLEDDGALVLQQADGVEQRIASGEVFWGG